jgi:hypothetical protein
LAVWQLGSLEGSFAGSTATRCPLQSALCFEKLLQAAWANSNRFDHCPGCSLLWLARSEKHGERVWTLAAGRLRTRDLPRWRLLKQPSSDSSRRAW